jgi:hypothetical protein
MRYGLGGQYPLPDRSFKTFVFTTISRNALTSIQLTVKWDKGGRNVIVITVARFVSGLRIRTALSALFVLCLHGVTKA